MRITKKYSGASCIGKQVFQPCPTSELTAEQSRANERELARLERNFLNRLGNKCPPSLTMSNAGVIGGSDTGNKFGEGKRKKGRTHSDIDRDTDEEDDTEFDECDVIVREYNNPFHGRDAPAGSDMMHFSHGGRIDHPKKSMKRAQSVPNLSMHSMITQGQNKSPTSSNSSTFRFNSKHNPTGVSKFSTNGTQAFRSQSLKDFGEFEEYVADDSAAGNLLLQFFDKLHRTHSSTEDLNSMDCAGGNTSASNVTTISSSSTPDFGTRSYIITQPEETPQDGNVGLMYADMEEDIYKSVGECSDGEMIDDTSNIVTAQSNSIERDIKLSPT